MADTVTNDEQALDLLTGKRLSDPCNTNLQYFFQFHWASKSHGTRSEPDVTRKLASIQWLMKHVQI